MAGQEVRHADNTLGVRFAAPKKLLHVAHACVDDCCLGTDTWHNAGGKPGCLEAAFSAEQWLPTPNLHGSPARDDRE